LFRRIVSKLSEEGSPDDTGIPSTKVVAYKGWKLFISIMGKRVGIIAFVFIIRLPEVDIDVVSAGIGLGVRIFIM
jgi:hypothetical protein